MGVVTINFIEVGSLLFEVTKNFRNVSEETICSGGCSKVVLQGSKVPDLQYVMLTRNHQETLL